MRVKQGAPAVYRTKAPHGRARAIHEAIAGWLFLLPSFVGVCVFVLAPFVDTVRRSFYNISGSQVVGLANYKAVFQNGAFHLAVTNTPRFLCTCIPLLLLVSLLLALAVHSLASDNGTRVYKTSYLLPIAIPVAAISLLWQVLFADKGFLNHLLTALGAEPVSFLSTSAIFWVLIVSYLWRNAGYDMILWLSGLDSISQSLYDAAAVDGANAWQQFWFITRPCLAPTLFVTAVLSLLNAFKAFREVYLVAGSYPPDAIYQLQHLFNNWFGALDIARLSAGAVLLAVILLILILLLWIFLIRRKGD